MWPVVNPEHCRLSPDRNTVEKIAEAINYAEAKGIAVDMYPIRLGEYIWNGDSYVSIDDSFVDMKCNAPYICSSIAWNGEVQLCCNYGDTVENMSDKSFQEVWNGERYQKLRRQVNDESNFPRSCMNYFG